MRDDIAVMPRAVWFKNGSRASRIRMAALAMLKTVISTTVADRLTASGINHCARFSLGARRQ